MNNQTNETLSTPFASATATGCVPATAGATDAGAPSRSAMKRSSSLFSDPTSKRLEVKVYTFGAGVEGQLGINDDLLETVSAPHLVETLAEKDIAGVACGHYHTAATTTDGELFTWGANDRNQCGVRGGGKAPIVPQPTRLEALENSHIGFIDCGGAHTVAVAQNGTAFGWGAADAGELGLDFGDSPPSKVERPKVVSTLKDVAVARVATGETHTLFLDPGGAVYSTGDGAAGVENTPTHQAAAFNPKRLPQLIPRLWPLCVTQVSAGDAHSAAVTLSGVVFTWGRGRSGALGHGAFENVSTPLAVRALATRTRIKQVSCGGDFTIAVGVNGEVWSFGQGRWGATGLSHTDAVCSPQRMTGSGISEQRVVQAAAGGRHTLILTASNQVWATGCNENGQCGMVVDESGSMLLAPRLMEKFPPSGSKVVLVAAGGNHSCVLVQNLTSEEYTGSEIEDTCVSYSDRWLALQPPALVSLAATAASEAAASAGTAVALSAPAAASAASTANKLNQQTTRALVEAIERTFANPAALLHTFSASPTPLAETSDNNESPAAIAARLTAAESSSQSPTKLPPWQRCEPAKEYYEASLAAQDVGIGTAIAPTMLDVALISTTYNNLLKLYDTKIVAALGSATIRLLDSIEKYLTALYPSTSSKTTSTSTTTADGGTTTTTTTTTLSATYAPDTVLPSPPQGSKGPLPTPLDSNLVWVAPVLFILLQNPLAGDQSYGSHIILRIGRILAVTLPASQRISARRALQSLLGRLSAETLAARCARPVNRFITKIVEAGRLASSRIEVLIAGVLLDVIRQANVDAGDIIQYSEFYNRALSSAADLQHEYLTWVNHKDKAPSALVSLCQMPFLLTPEAKSKIIHGESAVQKQQHMSAAAFSAFFQGLNPSEAGYLKLSVRRDHVVEDALNGLLAHMDGDLKKPLKVQFVSAGVVEPAQDEGGVRKEFFQLVSKDLFDPNFGMFTFDSETRTYWFNSASLESESEFTLVGALLGLAIYNGVLLDVHFPMVLYSKLLGGKPTFNDLKLAFPALARGLQSLLDYKPEDVETVFCRTFEVEYEFFGVMHTKELKPGGANVPITGDNRQAYVDLYTKWVLEDSIDTQFTSFARGFFKVCAGPAMSLLTPSELELLVCGLPHLDFGALRAAARYEGGYSAASPVVEWMWEVVHGMSFEQKKQFLSFFSGSDRAPVGGLGLLQLVVQRAGPDTDRLPTTHTCFNYLLLPEYSSKEKLKERLLTAITNAKGFGLQ